MNPFLLDDQIKHYLIEDIGPGDLSTTCIPEDAVGEGIYTAKAKGTFYGVHLITRIYQLYDPSISVQFKVKDGDSVEPGMTICKVIGKYRHLLETERVILNLVQHLSGVATFTRSVVNQLNDPTIKILDTRKTTPGLRSLEKAAVKCGGGYNHRFNLSDAVMLKDNHLAFYSTIKAAVTEVKKHISHMVKIEVEIETKEKLIEAIEADVDVIMFDNVSAKEIKDWIKLVPQSVQTEASGNITIDNINTFRGSGIDFISLGALTHSTQALDISLNIKERHK